MKNYKLWLFLLILVLSVVIIAFFQLPDGNLHIIACNVGQGDALLVTYKNIQILTDGGPDKSVMNCLGSHIPFWDRKIELAILSHPDSDHITGLIEVIKRYKVETIVLNGIDPGTQEYRVLENVVGSRGIRPVIAVKGTKIRLGMIYLDIVNPQCQLAINNLQFTKTETNIDSVAYLLTYAQFKAFFAGDIPKEVSNQIAQNWTFGSVNYIKVPHHGSVNGLTENLLSVLDPKVAVISVGAKNPWGFPSTEILKMLTQKEVEILRTDKMGDVEFITDGNRFWWKK